MAKRRKSGVVNLPFRSHFERGGPAGQRVVDRTIDLPFTSQDLPGALDHRNDCGPACVRMALDFLGLAPDVTIDQLAAAADSDDDGTTADDLVSLAASHGAVAMTHILPASALPPAPAILLVRYSGFRRESVENVRYWDASANNATFRHWMWWLGNETIDGRAMSVWNDPLYAAGSGKNVLHTPEELDAAFAPYGSARIAVTFAAIAGAGQADEPPLEVFAFDSGGARLRTAPTTQDPNNIIKLLPEGQRFMVLEPASSARLKLSSAGQTYWLRVRTDVDGAQREGFVAAWLVKAVADGAPPVVVVTGGAPYTWQDVINATAAVALRADQSYQDWLARAGFWGVFQASSRALPYTGAPIDGWPLPEEHRRKILDLLKLTADQIVAEVIAAQLESEARQKANRTGRVIGLHGAPGIGAPAPDRQAAWIDALKDMGVRWFKQCDDGDPKQRDILAWARRLKDAGIEPIIRYFRDRQFPEPLPDPYFEKMRLYAGEGIAWAEIGNEPNLDYEWKEEWNGRLDYNNPACIRPLAENWVRDAQRALDAGVRPAFYAFGPTDWRGGVHPRLSSVFFQSRVAIHLAENRRDETIDIFNRGGWFAVHCATYEQPDDFDPFRPDGTIWDITLRGYEIVRKCFRDTFGGALDVDAIPILSTEGGVFTPESTSMGGHIRLNTEEEHAQRVVAMFKWLELNSPLAAMCPWCVSANEFGGPFDARFNGDGWFKPAGNGLQPRPVVQAMRELRLLNEQAGPRGVDARALPPGPDAVRALQEIGIFTLPGAPAAAVSSPSKRGRAGRAKAGGKRKAIAGRTKRAAVQARKKTTRR
jgi:hypothetical protein